MIVKLKCIDNVNYDGEIADYLTCGKIYDAIGNDSEFALLDDEDDLIVDTITGDLHGKWEVINE